MRIISRTKIIEYYTEHADSRVALEEWFTKTKKAQWTCFDDIKRTFNSVDAVGNQHYVFNIRGNNRNQITFITTFKLCWTKLSQRRKHLMANDRQ